MMALLLFRRFEDTKMSGADRLVSRLKFPSLVWVTLAGMLVTRTAFFMVWPFLAVILTRDFHLAPARVGSVIGSAFLVSGLVGFYSGNLSDRFGRRRVMTAGCAGAVVAYATFATAQNVTTYTIGAFLVGLSRATFESTGTALIADNIADAKTRQLALHIRYYFINVAAAVGPLIGVAFGLLAKQPTFWIVAGVYACFVVVLDWGFRRSPQVLHPDAKTHASLGRAIAVLRADHQFLLLVAANFLAMCAYAQTESTLIQYLTRGNRTEAIALVAALLTTNAVTILTFQFPMLRLLGRYNLYDRTYLALTLFGAAFLAYAVLPVEAFAAWIVATWLLAVGEAVLFPTLQLQIDRMAQAHLRGTYFGAATLGGLGFGVGPFVGGWLLGRVGGPVTFTLTAVSVGLAALCYRQSHAKGG
jgi:MFS family permease